MHNNNLSKFLIISFTLVFSIFVNADDFEIITTKDGKTYFNVEVLKKTPTSLGISYSKTMNSGSRTVTTIPFSKMRETYQKKYGYDETLESETEIRTEQIKKTTQQPKIVDSKKNESLKDKILKSGKPVILRNGNIYGLNGKIIQNKNDSYKSTVYLGYKNYFLDNDEIYMSNNPVDAKNYLKALDVEIKRLREKLTPTLSKVEKTENDLRDLKDKLTQLEISQATKTYKTSSGTTTVVYDQTNVKNCQRDIKKSEAKLEALNAQYGLAISSLSALITEKQTQYDNYSLSLSRFEGSDSAPKYDSYFDSVVIVSTDKFFGSGFFITADGYIITNEHVVGDSPKAKITLYNTKELIAQVIKVDKNIDLALLKIAGSNYPFLRTEKTEDIKAGERVAAIGTPKNLDWTVTEGIVSAVRGSTIQTDTALNQGNSGGPLINIKTGRLVGIVKGGLENSEGLNFAIAPSEIFKSFPQLGNQ